MDILIQTSMCHSIYRHPNIDSNISKSKKNTDSKVLYIERKMSIQKYLTSMPEYRSVSNNNTFISVVIDQPSSFYHLTDQKIVFTNFYNLSQPDWNLSCLVHCHLHHYNKNQIYFFCSILTTSSVQIMQRQTSYKFSNWFLLKPQRRVTT